MASTYFGISFPFNIGTTSAPEAAADIDILKASIIQILLTKRGDRVNRPDFGINVLDMLFENNNDILGELVRLEVSTAIARYEPRVIVQDTVVTRTDTTLQLEIFFTPTGMNQQQSVAVQYAIA